MQLNGYRMLILTTMLGTAHTVAAASVLDQQQPTIDSVSLLAIGFGSNQKLAQVVTAEISGSLTQVALPVICFPGSDLIVEIQGVTAGTPNGSVLTSQTIPGTSLPPFFPAPPSFRGIALSTPLFFTAGSPFAIVLRSSGGCDVYPGPVGDPYGGGNLYFDALPNPPGWACFCDFPGDRFDLPFQTFVDASLGLSIPTISSLGLALLALTIAVVATMRLR